MKCLSAEDLTVLLTGKVFFVYNLGVIESNWNLLVMFVSGGMGKADTCVKIEHRLLKNP